jgi:GTP cyclohydrolase I
VTATPAAADDPAPTAARRLRVVHDRRAPDRAAARRAIADLLVALGRDPADPHLADTPRRVADAYAELLNRPAFDLTTFPNDEPRSTH